MKFELTNPKAWKAVSERNIPMAHKIKVYEKLGGAYRMGENGGEQVYNNIAELIKSKLNEGDGSDHEVGMALNLLDDVIKNANELKGKIGTEETDLAGWIQDHISQAQNFINQANTGFHKLDNSELSEGIKAFDERHYGKKGLIIMIDDNGKKLSAVFKDKKNADKYNRNNPEDLKKLAQLAQKAGFGNTIDEGSKQINEAFKHLIKIETPTQAISKPVAAQVEKLAKKGVRSKDIGLQMGFVGNTKNAVDAFQVLKNKIYFALDKKESINEATTTSISGKSGRTITTLDSKKYELKKEVKGARIGDYTNVVLPKGTIITNLPGGIFANHKDLKTKYCTGYKSERWVDNYGVLIRQMPETVHDIEKNGKVLESINENFPNMKKWWEEDKNEVMSFIYFLQRQLPPTNKEKYEKAWKDIVVQLQKRTPAPKNVYDKLVGEPINEVRYPTDLKVGSVILGKGFTMLKGIKAGKYYKVIDMDDNTATLALSDKNGITHFTNKVRHKLDSLEGSIKTAKRGDENGIVLMKETVNEGASKAELDKVRQAVEAASSFMSVGTELKKLGIRYVFATEPLPIYIVQQTPNNRIAIVNKKYATKPDFVVGDIAVGVMD